MRICPKCRTTYPSPLVEVCYRDGEKLVDHEAFVENENDPLRGYVVAGRYQIVERVGQGGMGTVYRASQEGLQRDVAIKILKRELNVDQDTVARFQREAKAMSMLTHANTVRVFDFGQTDDGLLYLVMELLEGELITEVLAREGALDVMSALRYAQQILRSLAEAHSKGIVHRDLKPDNMFVARVEGHDAPIIKVLDFGIAKVVAPDRRLDQFETQAGTVFGTPRYMSPEQAQGAALDPRSDLYSVGILLYQMLTGRPPFVDDDAVVVMAKHIRDRPDPPKEAAPDRPIPDSLEQVVMRALEKEPDQRQQDANEFDHSLEHCVRDVIAERAGKHRQRTVVQSTPRRARRALWVSAAAMLAGSMAYVALGPDSEEATTPTVVPLEVDSPASAALAPGQEGTTVVELPPQGANRRVPEQGTDVDAGPARVALRSDPDGAQVWRDERQVGNTPMELMVEPGNELVRVELRLAGYQPLTAELARTEGERIFKMTPAPRSPTLPAAAAKKRKKKRKRPAKRASRSSRSGGPYERFE